MCLVSVTAERLRSMGKQRHAFFFAFLILWDSLKTVFVKSSFNHVLSYPVLVLWGGDDGCQMNSFMLQDSYISVILSIRTLLSAAVSVELRGFRSRPFCCLSVISFAPFLHVWFTLARVTQTCARSSQHNQSFQWKLIFCSKKTVEFFNI